MRILCFQARHFGWKSFSKTLADVPQQDVEAEVHNALVAFVHVEAADADPQREASVFRQTLKHLKWLANKRAMRVVVLHSFTHLGGESAAPAIAHTLLTRLAERLAENGYETHLTPFGYFNEWTLSVYGDSLAKVWKQI
jgi:threonyl-tRNA synthetase editing subunit